MCDIWQRNKTTQHVIAYDVVCVHPNLSIVGERIAGAAAEAAAKEKKRAYAWCTAREADLVPLATDTYGGYAKGTWKCLHRLAAAMANNDQHLSEALARRMRERIATAIVMGQGRLIDEWNRLNRRAKGGRGARLNLEEKEGEGE